MVEATEKRMLSKFLILFMAQFHSLASGKGVTQECPTSLTTVHCHTDCHTVPHDIVCEAVEDDELRSLLVRYANITSHASTTTGSGTSNNHALRLTIRKSPNIHLSGHLFAPVIPHLWDLRLEQDTIVNELPAGAFEGLTNLRSLDLTGNRIAHLHAGDFSGLESLRGLKLERNPLIELASGVFDGLSNLQCLDLDDNALTCDCKLMWMKKWAAQHPQWWEDDKELYAEEREDCDGDMPDCEYPPMMKDKNVTEIPADVCDDFLTDLDCLDLQTVHCRTHCDNWTPVQMQCNDVGFEELHGLLSRFSRVVDRVLRLDISHSKHLTLNASLWLPVKDQLIHLNLNHGRYTLHAGAFSGLGKLILLELDDNELGPVAARAFEGLTALRGLTLDDTHTEHIAEGAFDPLRSLVCLQLDDHDEGLCECETKWLVKWMAEHATTVFGGDRVLMYDYGVKVFCHADQVECSQKSREELC